MIKTKIIVSHQNTSQLFVSHYTSCLKYQNYIFSTKTKNRTRPKIIQYHKNLSCVVLSYVVLFCLVLLCPVLTVLQIKHT